MIVLLLYTKLVFVSKVFVSRTFKSKLCVCVCVGEKCDIDCFLSSQKVTLTFTKYIKAMEMCGHITHTELQQEFKMQPKQVALILHLSFFRCSRLICSSTPRDRMFMQEYSTPILLAKHA